LPTYWFAVVALGDEEKRPDLSARIVERGMRSNQDSWYVPYIAGANQLLYAKNCPKAAEYYRIAARCPGAPAWLGPQVKLLEANVPTMFKEINALTNLYDSSEDERMKESISARIVPLWVKVYKIADSEPARKRAASELKRFGVDIEEIARRSQKSAAERK